MQLLNIRLSAIDESSFTIYARSDAGQAEYKSSLPFFETKTKWRTTLIKILEVIKFAPDRFSDEELAWMGQAGLLLADGSVLCADYLEKIGQAFYKAMFPEGEVRYLLERSLALAEQESNPQLHIQIEFNAGVTELNRLPDYPWEIVHDGQRFLAHHNVTFSRYIAHLSAPPKFSPVSPINVLLVSSGASDKVNGLAPLPEREREAVKKGLEKSQSDGHIRFSKLETASFKALETYLTENRGSNAPHILHFDGHGVFGKRCQSSECRTFSSNLKLEKCPKCQTALPSSQGYLLFEPDDDNNELEANYISAAELGSLLQSIRHGDTEAQQGGVRLAVLSACKSAYALGGNSVFNGVAQSLIGHGVPAVVAMQYTVSTIAATAFAERFYRELGNKQPLTVATSQGRVAMQNVEHNQWYRLIFYLRGQSNDGGQLFANSVEDVSHVRQTAKRLEIIPTEKLEKMYRESIAWCKVRFRSVIGDEQKAAELANDFSLGTTPANLDLEAQRLFILTGDFGVGKTLIVQRIFQNAVKDALENPNAQIPLYLHTDTWRQDKPLRAIIENEANTLGDIKTQGAIIIIDELDKAPVNEAFEIIKQSDFLTEIWRKTTIIITSRPIQNIEDTYENNLIRIPPLTFEQAHHLIEDISGQEVNPMRLRDLGASVKEVITYPLFTLLLGRYWREGDARPICTRAELLSNLVEDSLQQAGASQDAYKQLIKLAVRCIEFGNKAVPLADIDLSKSEQQALLDSRLVVRQSGGITFPLSIFTQWFAYRALEENLLQIEKYLQDPDQLENWRYALIVAIGISSQTITSKILTPIVEKYPSFAIEIIRSSLSNSLNSQRLSLPSTQDCGEQLRTSMSAWVKGIGNLAKLIAPIREDGTLCPVGVEIRHDNFLESGWYLGKENLANIQKLPDDSYITRSTWGYFQGRRPSHQSAWAWLWNLNTLRAALVSEISTATIPVNQGVISREASWRASLAIFQNCHPNLYNPQKISMIFLSKAMNRIDEEISQNDSRLLSYFSTTKEQKFCFDCLREEIKLMQAKNVCDFSLSYTDVDLAYKRMQWDSDPVKIENLKKRVEEIYKAALDEYQDLSKKWFENILSGMQIAGLLPARLVGVFTPPILPDNPYGDSPRFDWYLEPLPKDYQNIVEINFNEDPRNNAYENYCKLSSIIVSRLQDLRPSSSSWLRCNPYGGFLDISLFRSDAPVTVLVYSWLKEDLRSIGWTDSYIQHRSKLFG